MDVEELLQTDPEKSLTLIYRTNECQSIAEVAQNTGLSESSV